mmetsp:Transcript_33969/g.85193  ORF Transcript_33969/g.85193 Transcript_33969/m.85193 type:complete len:325 (+) Transcript_33969:675-1649(+)
MAQAAREEERAHVLGHHVVDVTLQQPPCLETLQELAGGQAVHVRPAHARLERHDHALEGGEHGAVHNPLVLRELAADGERGGDVRVVAVVLAAHVAHHHVTRLQLAVVGGARMAVVEHGAVGAGGADGRVGRVPAAAVGVAVVQEGRLQLVLHHARRAAAHHRDVSLARNLVRIAQRLDLHAGLVDSALGEDKVQAGGLHLKGIHPLKLRRRRGAPTSYPCTRSTPRPKRIASSGSPRLPSILRVRELLGREFHPLLTENDLVGENRLVHHPPPVGRPQNVLQLTCRDEAVVHDEDHVVLRSPQNTASECRRSYPAPGRLCRKP